MNKTKLKKEIDHAKALDFIAEYICYDMQSKDRLIEIQWLLEQVYKDCTTGLIDDWNLTDTEQWDNSIERIYKEKTNGRD
tara:strand:+ start:903 stop:1142 length:240 start_codon:yes stop_codon:yes gene_type:complete